MQYSCISMLIVLLFAFVGIIILVNKAFLLEWLSWWWSMAYVYCHASQIHWYNFCLEKKWMTNKWCIWYFEFNYKKLVLLFKYFSKTNKKNNLKQQSRTSRASHNIPNCMKEVTWLSYGLCTNGHGSAALGWLAFILPPVFVQAAVIRSW